MPSVDETGALVSSSDVDGKPASLDGKSVASATTFALDEKESLRPDDSASVQAGVDDEDLFTAPGSGVPNSRLGSEDGVPAFRDQLHEINAMEPTRRPETGSGPPSGGPAGVLYVPPQGPGIGSIPGSSRPITALSEEAGTAPDHKLLEALENPRDRIWVLKLEQDVIDFIKDAKEVSLNLPQCNSFYRMLAHKIADYYMLGHAVDDSNAVRLFKAPNCRIPRPLTGMATPPTAASTPPPGNPQMKILRRGMDSGPAIANGSNMTSMTNSENGESGDDDKKRPVTREEREARYEAARLRIMGSAKPVESPDLAKEIDESRSSSAAGKKKKKPRGVSDDDFQARSAYSTFYNSGTYQANSLAYQSVPGVQASQLSSALYGGQPDTTPYQQYAGQVSTSQWPTGGYQGQEYPQAWTPGQQQGYDLSKNFAQVMAFQPQPMPTSSQHVQSPYGPGYLQQPYNANTWPQQPQAYQQQPQTFQGSYPSFQSGYGNSSGYPDRSASSTSQHAQPPQAGYAFGQLPSQVMGRQPNALEHPLPGSYKSPHFNPQSQAFVPGHTNNQSFHPFTPQRAATMNAGASPGFGMPHPLERQLSSQSQGSSFGSTHQTFQTPAAPRAPPQPLTHPLPQPVFPRQPSPNMPLPPKPISGSQNLAGQANSSPPTGNGSSPQSQSSIAKWGTPASLPAKPPPSAEPFDAARFAQAQRAPSFNPAARISSGGLSAFNSMSPGMVTGGASPGSRRS